MRFTKPKGVQVRNLAIPAGDRWTDARTGEAFEGGRAV